MAESTEFHSEIAAPARSAETSALQGLGRALKRFFANAIFWRYERGSWQYDVICAVILAFIFLPRSWFRDRPQLQLSDLRHLRGVVEVGHVRNQYTYQIDARLVESVMQDRSISAQKPEDAIRAILRPRVKGFLTVKSFEPIRDKNNVILGYTVITVQ